MSSRSIVLSGDVTSAMFQDFCTQMDILEDADSAPIIVRLNSNGGNTADALAIAGRIRESTNEVITVGYGHIMSAATLILAAGDKRKMSKHAWFMIHDARDRATGTAAEMKRAAKQLAREEAQWIELMADFTGVPKALWAELTANSTHLTATECKNLTIIDELI
jgi:ATP-dependent Clp protease protease subunit